MRGNESFQSANRRRTSPASQIGGVALRRPIDNCSHRRPFFWKTGGGLLGWQFAGVDELTSLDGFGGVAGDDGPGGDVAGDDGAGGDNSAFADFHAWQDDCSRTNPCRVADLNRFRDKIKCVATDVVRCSADKRPFADNHIGSYLDVIYRVKRNTTVYPAVVANPKPPWLPNLSPTLNTHILADNSAKRPKQETPPAIQTPTRRRTEQQHPYNFPHCSRLLVLKRVLVFILTEIYFRHEF